MAKVPNAVEILPKLQPPACRVHERYRQTDDRQTDRRQTDRRQHIANVNVSSRSLKKLCRMFRPLPDWYTIYTFLGALAPDGIMPGAKFILRPSPCILLYWQCYCTALEESASAKLCGVVQGMELWNFRRRRHLYSAGWPSRWASAHILVLIDLID